MKRLIILLTMVMAMSMTVVPISIAQEDSDSNRPSVQLTPEQKSELDNLHKTILEKRKELIAKYVEFGLISAERGKELTTQMEQHFERMKDHDFMKKWDHSKHKKDKSHE